MRRRIEKCGMRSISLAVDITNYVMLELGQPLHAFDAKKISGGLNIRRAGTSKQLKSLDGVVRKLSSQDLVVADSNEPLALAGVMGGESSEVTSETTSIALEGARFNPIAVAQNSRTHILSSEASRRLERGVDPKLAKISTARAIDLMIKLGGAKYVGTSSNGVEVLPKTASLDVAKISKLLGLKVADAKVNGALTSVGCKVVKGAKVWKVAPPTWRPDLVHFSDFAEEVARQIGYDQIPNRLPISKNAGSLTLIQKRKRFIGAYLSSAGFSEVYSSPFQNQSFIESLGFSGDRAKTFKLANPMSEEFPVLRTHLIPGLLQTAVRNIGRGTKDVAIFEIGSIFRNTTNLQTPGDVETSKRPSVEAIKKIYASVPKQPLMMCGFISGRLQHDGWQGSGVSFEWSEAIQVIRNILDSLGMEYEISSSDFAPWHPGRCAEFRVGGKAVAHAGELHPKVIEEMGIAARSCAFGLLISELPEGRTLKSTPVKTMTPVIQDLAVVVNSNISLSELSDTLSQGAGEYLESIKLFDRYDKMGDGKISYAFTLTFRAADRTLTSEEVNQIKEQAVALAKSKLGAELR
jgi:phenylalanyl-tRNA synthetase beta chain